MRVVSKHRTPDEVVERIQVVRHELNLLLRLAPDLSIKVDVDTIDHDRWTEIVTSIGKR